MSVHKLHNVSVLISEELDKTLKETCAEISKRYEIRFLEIGAESDHVYFLIQSVQPCSPTEIVGTVKSITAKEIVKKYPEVKKHLWGGEFWSDGHFVSTVSKHGNEDTVTSYVKTQGRAEEYKRLHKIADKNQPLLFDEINKEKS